MSDTDDTDELLLIPPDLFVIDSEFEEPYVSAPYYGIVDTLITQVNHLEHRINYIVSASDSTTTNDSLGKIDAERKAMAQNHYKNMYNYDYIPSTQSTPQKPRTIFKVNSLPPTPTTKLSPNKYANRRASPKAQYSTDGSSESEKVKLLNEIDNFISNVKFKSRTGAGAARNLENDYDNKPMLDNQRSLELKEVNALLDDIEVRISNNTNVPSVNMLTTTSISDVLASDATCAQSDSLPSLHSLESDSTQVTAYHNGNPGLQSTNVYEETSRQQQKLIPNNNDKRLHFPSDYRSSSLENGLRHDREARRLFSLTDLWGQYPTENGANNISTRLEEERLRRKHCEELIQDLQHKILELQERLAVAIEVDQNKDKAILRFHDAWKKVAIRLESLKNDKLYLERDLQELQGKSAKDIADAAKKVVYYETEASKALNIAHNSTEKITNLENQNAHTIMEIDSLQKQLESLKGDYEKLDLKNTQLNEILAQKELAIKEKEKAVSDALKEVSEGKKTVEICEAEFITMNTQYKQLELDFKDAKTRIGELERDRKKLLADNDSYKKIEKDLHDQVQRAKESTDKSKTELRNFYQNQVEVVVKDKLKEFQEQLENAEKSMHEEIKHREITIARTAAQHIHNLEEKHTLEVQLLEEKHSEEIRLYGAKLGHANQRIESLESKLQEQTQRRDKIAQQLHKIMEVQWLEAIKLLNNNKMPSSPDIYNDQFNQLKSKSYSNLEELLSPKESPEDDRQYNKELVQSVDETPVNSKPHKSRQQIESELQKYVQMLLPKASVSGSDTKGIQIFNGNDRNNWHQELAQDESNRGSKSGSSRDRRLSKPPWK